MIRIDEIRIPLRQWEQLPVLTAAARKIDVAPETIRHLQVVRQGIDARKKQDIQLVYTVQAVLDEATEQRLIRKKRHVSAVAEQPRQPVAPGNTPLTTRPVVVGAGPAGLFAALTLAAAGYEPVLLEQGEPTEQRVQTVQAFTQTGKLDPYSNIQFGEGGAGTFSDGKLTTRIRDPLCRTVLEILERMGAPSDILTQAHPHVGTDVFHRILPNIRREIQRLGGAVRFSSRVTELTLKEDTVQGVRLADGSVIETPVVIMAAGHSARPLFERLLAQGVCMTQRPFAMGVRIEHRQSWLDQARYGLFAGHPALGAAEYAVNTQVDGRSVHSFCMCPGGTVVNASSEPGGVCVNGMSSHARDGVQCNAALVCRIETSDFASEHPLAGIALQRKLEQAAFQAGGGTFCAPAQRLEDFLSNSETIRWGEVVPTIAPGAVMANLNNLLPETMSAAIKDALPQFDRKIKGFACPDAVLTAMEARTSSPVRMNRDANGQSVSTEGLYPAGEGAGYAGGITSSAVDGIRQAEHIIGKYRFIKGAQR